MRPDRTTSWLSPLLLCLARWRGQERMLDQVPNERFGFLGVAIRPARLLVGKRRTVEPVVVGFEMPRGVEIAQPAQDGDGIPVEKGRATRGILLHQIEKGAASPVQRGETEAVHVRRDETWAEGELERRRQG